MAICYQRKTMSVALYTDDGTTRPQGGEVKSAARKRQWLSLWILLVCCWQAAPSLQAAGSSLCRFSQSEAEGNQGEESWQQWVVDLGADEFRQREEARRRLQAIGAEAFDVLYAARNDQDIERRLAVRALLREIKVDFAGPDAPKTVRQHLGDYGVLASSDRLTRIATIAGLDPEVAATPLARIARYELSDELSKRAALELMRVLKRPHLIVREQIIEAVQKALRASHRDSTEWIKLAISDLAAKEVEPQGTTSDPWAIFVSDELARRQSSQSENETQRLNCRDLVRWQVDRLIEDRQPEVAEIAARSLVSLLGPSRGELIESLDWLMRRQMWGVIDEVAVVREDAFSEDPLLLYHLAEGLRRAGRDGSQVAEQARDLSGDDGRSHVEVALQLQERGMKVWAKQEYRLAIECTALGSIPDLDARWLLADMEADEGSLAQAAETLRPLVDGIERDADIEKQVRRRRDPKSVKGRMEYFQAIDQERKGELPRAWGHLVAAHDCYPSDTRILIAMHRLSENEESWRTESNRCHDLAVGYYLDRIGDLEKRLGEYQESGVRRTAARMLASYHNRLAWLTVQTQGDIERALSSATRAVDLAPESASYFDTLAHVYASMGDWQAAIGHQANAVKLQPHSSELQEYLSWLQKQAAIADR